MDTNTRDLHIGPFTQAAHITIQSLESGQLDRIPQYLYKQGLALEIYDYGIRHSPRWTESEIVQILYDISPCANMSNTVDGKTMKSRLQRWKNKRNHLKKGSVKYIQFMDTVMSTTACGPTVQPVVVLANDIQPNNPPDSIPRPSQQSLPDVLSTGNQAPGSSKYGSVFMPTSTQCLTTTCDATKGHNQLQHKIKMKEKRLRQLDKLVKTSYGKLEKAGHYSKKNVDKRQNTALSKFKECQKLKRLTLDQNCKILELKTQLDTIKEQNVQLFEQNRQLNEENDKLKKEKEIFKKAKIAAQKDRSRLKKGGKQLRTTENVPSDKVSILQERIKTQNQVIHGLEVEVDKLKEGTRKVLNLKDGKAYTIELRMLVNKLTSLEVAQDNVSPVIDAVAYWLFDTEIENLPSRKTVQSINDQGHYIMKRFIASEVQKADSIAALKDGTLKKQQKILNTSVTTSSGVTYSMGFCTVASETGAAIAATTQMHLEELASVSQLNQDFLVSSLSKLIAYVSDRASNEKLSNKLLDKWRTEVLSNADIPISEQAVVHYCYCMAHVLLGFHKYIITEVQKVQKVAEEEGPIGRDALDRFSHYWQQSIPERVAYTASSVFGPVGDYKGARKLWETHCSLLGIKSKIGNYKDNRFNGLFETCAQVCHHKQDFFYILQRRSSNGLLQSLKADLGDPRAMVFVQAMGIIFVQVTGPYWNLIENKDVPYTSLSTVFQPLLHSIEGYIKDPSELLLLGPQCMEAYKDNTTRLYSEAVLQVSPAHEQLLFDILKASSTGLKNTIEAQLSEFFGTGKYANTSSTTPQTAFIPKTNLACERHFGELDSSMRKRPNCSLHHHSTVQLLKHTKQANEWYNAMSKEKQKALWEDAIKHASGLRESHKKHEIQQREIGYRMAEKRGEKAKEKTDNIEPNLPECSALENELTRLLPEDPLLNIGDWVVIAYTDNWHPGKIIEEEGEIKVDFMHRTTGNQFRREDGRDIQLIHSKYILGIGLDEPKPLGRSKRHWIIESADYFDNLFMKFKAVHF